jgi:two-component system, cell cycle response regulator
VAVRPIRANVAVILIIEDSSSQRAEIRAALEQAALFERILEAGDGLQGLRLLLSEPVDLVLCDLEMPGLDGAKLLHASRAAGGATIPFLVLTAEHDVERKARLLRDGARDAISKPFHIVDLIARIELHLELVRLQGELEKKNRLLEELSVTDALTGLRNRRYLDEVLRLDFLRAQRFGGPLSVIMADIDLFKGVNDMHGHATGDAVLRAVAERFRMRLRESDVAARYGGEEFALLLRGSGLEGAAVAAERWRADIASSPFATGDGEPLCVTVSMGVASFRPEMREAGELLCAADEALYRAKQRGRNQVAIACDDELDPSADTEVRVPTPQDPRSTSISSEERRGHPGGLADPGLQRLVGEPCLGNPAAEGLE